MIFLIVGLDLLFLVFGIVAYGIRHNTPKPVHYFHNAAFDMKLLHGGHTPSLPGDLIHANLSVASYFNRHTGEWVEGDYLEYLKALSTLPVDVYNQVTVHGSDDSDYVSWAPIVQHFQHNAWGCEGVEDN